MQGPRLVAGQLQALDVRGEVGGAAADLLRRAPRALREQRVRARCPCRSRRAPAAARRRRRTAARGRRSGRARRTPSPRRSCRRPRWCRCPARRTGRWRPGRRRGRTPRTSGRGRRRSRTPRASGCRRGRDRCARSRCVHDAQLLRATLRSPASSSAARAGAPSKVAAWKLRVGSVDKRVERQQVGQRAELAVLRGRRARTTGPAGPWRRRAPPAGSAGATFAAGADGDGLDVLGASTAPSPPRPACRPSCDRVAKRTPRSPAGPDRGDPPGRAEPLAQPRPRCRRRTPAVSRSAGSSRTSSPSTSSTLGRARAPVTTIASCPVSLPAMAKWLEARASVSSPVSGDLATTANLALVVSGVPTSGEKTKASGAVGRQRVDAGRRQVGEQPDAEPGAADVVAQHPLGELHQPGAAVGDVDDQGPAEVAAGRRASVRRRPRRGTRRCRPAAAAGRRPGWSGRR